jgi:hypothetical protein
VVLCFSRRIIYLAIYIMDKYNKVSFIKITDNNNHQDFSIDATRMLDPRLRIGALKSQYKIYQKTGKQYKNVFKYFDLDFSFYVIKKGSFYSYEEVKAERDKLYNLYKSKLENKNI